MLNWSEQPTNALEINMSRRTKSKTWNYQKETFFNQSFTNKFVKWGSPEEPEVL